MSESESQPDTQKSCGVEWRDWATWGKFCLVFLHLSLIVLAILTFSAAVAERILPYEGKAQIMMGAVTAFLLWCINFFFITKTAERIEPDGSKYLRFIGSADGSLLFLGWLWILLFPCFNAFLIAEIWTVLSFESPIRYYAIWIILSAYFSIPYVVAILRGGIAERSNPGRSLPLTENGELQS